MEGVDLGNMDFAFEDTEPFLFERNEFPANIKVEVEDEEQEIPVDYENYDQEFQEGNQDMGFQDQEQEDAYESTNNGDMDHYEDFAEFPSASDSPSGSASSSSESDDLELEFLPSPEPLPVVLPPESINAILESQEILDPAPIMVECLGNAALQQLRQIILVASHVGFHGKSHGIKLKDFMFAEKHANNSTNEAVLVSSIFEEPQYEMSSSGIMVPGQGPSLNLAKQIKNPNAHQKQLERPASPTVSFQRITFHTYQKVESSDSDCSGTSDEEAESDSENEMADMDMMDETEAEIRLKDDASNEFFSKAENQNTSDSSESTSNEDEDENDLSDPSETDSEENSQFELSELSEDSENEELSSAGTESDVADNVGLLPVAAENEDPDLPNQVKDTPEEDEAPDGAPPEDENEEAANSSTTSNQTNDVESTENNALDELSEYVQEKMLATSDYSSSECDDEEERSNSSSSIALDDRSVESQDESENESDEADEDQAEDDTVDNVDLNAENIEEINETASGLVQEIQDEGQTDPAGVSEEASASVPVPGPNKDSVESESAPIAASIKAEITEIEIEDGKANCDFEDKKESEHKSVESDQGAQEEEKEEADEDVGERTESSDEVDEVEAEEDEVEMEYSDSEAEAENSESTCSESGATSTSSQTDSDTISESESSESEPDDADEPNLSEEWIAYMDVLVEEFVKLKDEFQPFSTQQLAKFGEDIPISAPESEFSLFVDDISQHGLLPVISVWCDFCHDFLSYKVCPTISRAHLHGIFSLFDALLKNRISECITLKQMKEITTTLIKMTFISPPWDVHRHLASIFGLILKKARDGELVDLISWICSFVSTTLEWFTTSTDCLDDWDRKCRIFNIALLVVNQLEELGYHFIRQFDWHEQVTNTIRTCDALVSLREFGFDHKTINFNSPERRRLGKRKSTSPMGEQQDSDLNAIKAEKNGEEDTKLSQTTEVIRIKPDQGQGAGVSERLAISDQKEDFSANVEKCKKIIRKILKTLDDTPGGQEWSTKLEDIIEFVANSEKSLAETTEPSGGELIKQEAESAAKIKEIVDTMEDKTLGESVKKGLCSGLEICPPSESGAMQSVQNEETSSSAPAPNRSISEFESKFIHPDMENGMLLFFKTFLRNYSSEEPPSALAETQKLASLYFGDKINHFISSSEVLQRVNAKRRKIEQRSLQNEVQVLRIKTEIFENGK